MTSRDDYFTIIFEYLLEYTNINLLSKNVIPNVDYPIFHNSHCPVRGAGDICKNSHCRVPYAGTYVCNVNKWSKTSGSRL